MRLKPGLQRPRWSLAFRRFGDALDAAKAWTPTSALEPSDGSYDARSYDARLPRLLQRFRSAYDRQRQLGGIQVHGQLGAGFGPQGKIAVAGKNHESDLLPRRNNLVVGLKVKSHFVKFTFFQRFAFRE